MWALRAVVGGLGPSELKRKGVCSPVDIERATAAVVRRLREPALRATSDFATGVTVIQGALQSRARTPLLSTTHGDFACCPFSRLLPHLTLHDNG